MYLLTNFTVKVLIVALVVFGIGLIMYFTSIRKKDEPAAVTKSKQQVTGATK